MPRETTARSSSQDAYDRIAAALESAARFVPRERGEAMFRKWLPRRDRDIEGLAEDRMIAMAADAMLLAADLLLSQPSASGATAFDRLAKNRAGAAPEEAAAIAALRKARFRLLRIEETTTPHDFLARDVLSDEVLSIAGPDLPPLAAAVLSRDAGRAEIAFAVERLLLVQLETVRRREASGVVALTLNAVAAALDDAMRSRAWSQRVRTLFETLRAQAVAAAWPTTRHWNV